jgi:hypothetical protein
MSPTTAAPSVISDLCVFDGRNERRYAVLLEDQTMKLKKADPPYFFRDLAICCYCIHQIYGNIPQGRGRRITNPYRDFLTYIAGEIGRMHLPNRPKITWTEAYKFMQESLLSEVKREVVTYIPIWDGIYVKETTPMSRYLRDKGVDFGPVALSISGVRSAYARGKKIFELIREKRKELSDQLPGFPPKAVKDPDGCRTILV